MMSFISKIITNPIESFLHLLGLVRGTFCIFRYRIFNNNVRIDFPFTVFAPVKIIGPGSVSIGKGCYVYKNVFKGLSIVTQSSSAKVTVGEKCMLGGLTIRCRQKVIIGDRMMTALSLIQDSFFINQDDVSSRECNGLIPESKPITIGMNVWLGGHSVILGGSRFGNDSVFSLYSSCLDAEVGDYCLAMGNPAVKNFPIDKLLKLKGVA